MRKLACFLVAASVLSCFALGAFAGEKKIMVGYTAPALYGGQLDIMNGLVKYVEDKGWGIITTNGGNDAQKQINQVDDFINLGVDAIVVNPANSATMSQMVRNADRAGVPIFSIDNMPKGAKVKLSVVSDNVMAGRQAGEYMVKLLTAKFGSPKGTVLELQGDLGTSSAQDRGKGFHEVVDKYPDITVVSKTTNWMSDRFASITRDVVSVQDIDGIFLQSDNIGVPAVVPTLNQIGKLKKRGEDGHIFITGVDGGPAALNAIRDGWVDGVSQQPLNDDGIVVEFIEKTLNGETWSEGPFAREGALWSPAQLVNTDSSGWVLYLSTALVTEENVDDPRLYGNQAGK